MPRDYEERAARNDASRSKAEHYREPWGADELDLLFTWDHSEEELAVMAELLGRTIEACRQRFYLADKPVASRVTSVEVHVRQWLVGYCFECGRFTDVYSDGIVSLCEECR